MDGTGPPNPGWMNRGVPFSVEYWMAASSGSEYEASTALEFAENVVP